MYSRIKISYHRYSGRFLPHAHTSYASLAFLIILMAVVLGTTTVGVESYNYGDPNPGPFAGSVALTGTVKEPPPTQAAVITNPTNGQSFSATPITVNGTCPTGTIIELFKNNIFAGSTPCQNDATFSLQTDLLYGPNALVAQVFDVLDQAGPFSNTVNVNYTALPQQTAPIDSSNLNDIQLLLRTSPVYRGIFPGTPLSVPIDVIAGSPPFAINIDWGDNTSDLISRADNTEFNANHTYAKPGTYQITLRATDNKGRLAFLTFIAVVNGKAEIAGSVTTTPTLTSGRNTLLIVWPLLGVAGLLVSSFWFGERREKQKLAERGELIPAT
ncbi:MAG: PKD domain-containing protein [Candidatus Saccharimonadia bacterium]